MGKDNFIDVGDKVDIHFVSSDSIFGATVIHLPYSSGDQYRVKTDKGQIVYIGSFERMNKIEEGL